MIRFGAASGVLLLMLMTCPPANGQEPPPRIGPFVLDFHGTFPKFPSGPAVAAGRGLDETELPGLGLGLSAGAHLYLFKVSGVTFGIGGEATIGRSHFAPSAEVSDLLGLVAVTETFKAISPQLSLNFGSGNGWSYLSAGVGRAKWSIVPDGAVPQPADEEPLNIINYGAGARWFAKPHLAFSLDVRFYEIRPGALQGTLVGPPHAVVFIIGAGISVR